MIVKAYPPTQQASPDPVQKRKPALGQQVKKAGLTAALYPETVALFCMQRMSINIKFV
jgi:hypothetical protein